MPRLSRLALTVVVLVGAVLAACEDAPRLSPYEQRVVQARFERDMSLRDKDRTILTPAVRTRFGGLRYFPVDSTLRFALPLDAVAVPETIRVSLQQGGADRYVRLGTVAVPIAGGPFRLAVYQPVVGEPVLWLPFTDATSGRESYGGGRYLYPTRSADGRLLVDFNAAQNPNCDYNPDLYNCPLPPAENRLPVAVRAGEMKSLLH